MMMPIANIMKWGKFVIINLEISTDLCVKIMNLFNYIVVIAQNP